VTRTKYVGPRCEAAKNVGLAFLGLGVIALVAVTAGAQRVGLLPITKWLPKRAADYLRNLK
jgi:hypothetical protein